MAIANIAFLDDEFKDTPEAENGPSVPDGKYVARVESVEMAETTGDAPKAFLKQELIITEGEHEGKTVHRNSFLPSDTDTPERVRQSLGFFKRDLKSYGIDCNAPDFTLSNFLTNQLSEILDRVVKIHTKFGPDKKGTNRMNVYLDEYVGLAGSEGEGGNSSTVVDPTDPFGSE